MSEPKDTAIFLCGSPFGIGGYRYVDEDGKEQSGYGFYRPENPHDFFPDHECCSEKELAAHKAACDEWDRIRKDTSQ